MNFSVKSAEIPGLPLFGFRHLCTFVQLILKCTNRKKFKVLGTGHSAGN